MGTWCTTGLFLYEVRTLRHVANSGVREGRRDICITLRSWAEPKTCVFAMSRPMTVIEAIDDRGHSLTPEAVEANATPQGTGTFLYFNGSLSLGRRLARLSLIDHCLIQRASVPIRVSLAPTAAERAVGGIKLSVTTSNSDSNTCCVTLSVRRTPDSPLKLDDLQTAMWALRPRLLDGAGTQLQFRSESGVDHQDPVTVRYFWSSLGHGNSTIHPSTLIFDLPTDIKVIDIPVQFHDLPLP